jgi:hypothetical protein
MTTRRLAAILAADVVGFSSMMERDEEGTLRRLKTLQGELIEPRVREHHGRIVKTTGHGFLMQFGSPLEAVRCALEVQEMMNANGGVRCPACQGGLAFYADSHHIFGDVSTASRASWAWSPSIRPFRRSVRRSSPTDEPPQRQSPYPCLTGRHSRVFQDQKVVRAETAN